MMTHYRLFPTALILVTLLSIAVTPPFSVPDETPHFNKAIQYSELMLFNIRRDGELGNDLPGYVTELEQSAFPTQVAEEIVPTYHLSDVTAAWSRTYSTEPRFADFSLIAGYPPTLYLPQVAGIAVARALRLPPLAIFYAARLFNAVAFLALALAALHLMPIAKPPLVALLAFPTVAHQAASCSADATIMGVAFLTLALVLRLALRPGTNGQTVATLPLIVLLALAKAVYLPVALAGLALGPRRAYWVGLGASLAAGVVAFGLWASVNAGNVIRQPLVDRFTHQHVLAALPGEQLAFTLQHPVFVAGVVLGSFVERLPVYVVEVIGRFGWLTVMMPLPFYCLGLALSAGALLHPANVSGSTTGQRLFWAALLAGGIVLIETALYLTATRLGAAYVQGTQGRYFIPLLPLVGLVLSWPLPPHSRLGSFIARAFTPGVLVLMAGGLLVRLTAFWSLSS